MALAALVGGAPAAADGHRPPRVALLSGGERSTDFSMMGQWYGSPAPVQECPALIIDPAPAPPGALGVGRGRRRIQIVYRTPRRPARAYVEVYRDGEGGRVQTRLRPRMNDDGERVGWTTAFRARVGRRTLDVFPTAVWRDENGCGREFIKTYFRLR